MAVRATNRLQRAASEAALAVKQIDIRTAAGREYLGAVLPIQLAARDRPWMWYNRLGEIHYGVSRSARIAGYATLFGAKLNPKGEIDSIVDSGPVADIVQGIYSPYGGVRDLIERFYTQMKVPGDSHLIKVAENSVDGYMFVSPSELRHDGDVPGDSGIIALGEKDTLDLKWVTMPRGPLTGDGYGGATELSRKVARRNYLGRVWHASAQYVDMADSPLRALDTECELLYTSTQTLKAKFRQRLAAAGILYVPSQIQSIASGDEKATSEDKILDSLVEIFTRNIESWDSAQALAPIIFRGDAQYADALKFIQMERDVFETDILLRRELIERILFGLDIQKQAATGESENRYQAWNSSDEERRVAVQPDLEAMCWALNRLILARQLKKADLRSGENVTDFSVWFSLDRAAIRAHRQEDTIQARDRILVSDAATRRGLGVHESDAIKGPEQIRAIGHYTKNPVLMAYKLPEYDDIDWELALKMRENPGPKPGVEDPPPGPGQGDPGGPGSADPDTPDDSE